MKWNYFLRGLGVGILLTTLILCINYRANDSGGNVVEKAKELGMVFPEGTQTPISAVGNATNASVTEDVKPSPEATISVTTTPKPTTAAISSGAGVTGDSEATTKPKRTAKPTKKPVKKSNGSTQFTVRDGLLSSTVARELMEAGIIKDRKAFDRYLEDNNYAQLIREGTYDIPKGASYDKIARIITKQD